MSAKNLCTTTYLNSLRRHGPQTAVGRPPPASKTFRPCEEQSTIAASSDCVSESSATRSELTSASNLKVSMRPRDEEICWEDIRLGHRFQPYRQYAHCVEDIHVLAVFLGLADLEDVNGDCVKILLRALKLLHLCDYSAEDICSTLAHASHYFLATYSICGKSMDPSEVSHILVLLMFLAHVYVQDETCPLKVWHQHLFRKYCPLKTLNAAVIRLMDIRDHVLRVPSFDLSSRYTQLMQASPRWSARLKNHSALGLHCIVDGQE